MILLARRQAYVFFFFNDTAATEIYTLSLHDALPILGRAVDGRWSNVAPFGCRVAFLKGSGVSGKRVLFVGTDARRLRSEEHTSELQSRQYLVCRLLLEKKHQNAARPTCPPGLWLLLS